VSGPRRPMFHYGDFPPIPQRPGSHANLRRFLSFALQVHEKHGFIIYHDIHPRASDQPILFERYGK
jgi:hypothetical protein